MAAVAPFTPMSAEPGLGQFRRLTAAVSEGRLPVDELIQNFRGLHEAIEHGGRPQYRSKDEARRVHQGKQAVQANAPE
jgi:hypothetical protein